MTIIRRAFRIRVTRDRAVETLSLAAFGGAVICAGVAGGVEMAGGVALLAVRARPGRAAGRYRELRFDGDTWTMVGVDGGVVAIEPPVVHLAHRVLVVLEVVAPGSVRLPGVLAVGDSDRRLAPAASPPAGRRALQVSRRGAEHRGPGDPKPQTRACSHYLSLLCRSPIESMSVPGVTRHSRESNPRWRATPLSSKEREYCPRTTRPLVHRDLTHQEPMGYRKFHTSGDPEAGSIPGPLARDFADKGLPSDSARGPVYR